MIIQRNWIAYYSSFDVFLKTERIENYHRREDHSQKRKTTASENTIIKAAKQQWTATSQLLKGKLKLIKNFIPAAFFFFGQTLLGFSLFFMDDIHDEHKRTGWPKQNVALTIRTGKSFISLKYNFINTVIFFI